MPPPPETTHDEGGLLERAVRSISALRPWKIQPKALGSQAHSPYRSFVSSAGQTILVIKEAADNDALTLTIARPHDHWLHRPRRAGRT